MHYCFTILCLLTFALYSLNLSAWEVCHFHLKNDLSPGASIARIDSIRFSGDANERILLCMKDTTIRFEHTEVDSISFSNDPKTIHITWTEEGKTRILNPKAFEGIDITTENGHVVVQADTEEELTYALSGKTTEGSLKIYSTKKFELLMNGVDLTNNSGPAINIQSGKKATITLATGLTNRLADGSSYTPYGSEDMKGTLFSEGQLIFTGEGNLEIIGNKKHGICSDDYIEVKGGNLVLKEIVGDGIHANDYIKIENGQLDICANDDALDGETGYIHITGGNINIDIKGNAAKGIKCDSLIHISGGTTKITATGNVVIEEGDPSYCSAIKTDGNICIDGGTLTIQHSGAGGKGFSADGNISIFGGYIDITTTGKGTTYTNTEGQTDAYSATCIKADGDILIEAGNITTRSTGAAGKGISADGELTIGTEASSPIIEIKTSGGRFIVSGRGENADYANPKAIKSEGDLTIHNGNITVECTQDGGEGIESKSTLTIAGGTLEIETVDDAINASKHLAINGGKIYCNASGNDGIDSNGTISISGGLTLTSGTSVPEEGIDCDQNQFAITGGIIIGTGGATSTPTSSACTQRCVVYNTSGLSGKLMHIADGDGNGIITYQLPQKSALSGQMVMVISSNELKANTSYTLYTGGSVSGGNEFHGYYTDAIYSNGSSQTTFTTTNMVTTIGSGGGGFPGGGGGFPGGRPW